MILCIVMMASLVSQSVLADCNPRTDIKTVGADSYLYQEDCHIDYGRLRQAEPLYKEQTKELKKSIEMKDLALKYSDERTENWKKTTYKLEDKLLKVEKNNDRMKWVYFGLGIITTSAAVYAAGQLR
jgi:hypothetical protein